MGIELVAAAAGQRRVELDVARSPTWPCRRSTWRPDSCTSPLTVPHSSVRTFKPVAITLPLTGAERQTGAPPMSRAVTSPDTVLAIGDDSGCRSR